MSRSINMNLIKKWANDNQNLEIPLWLETIKDSDNRIVNLKCKACTHFVKEIKGLPTFKRTWIDGYKKSKICDLKIHASGKPHEKALRSYKASILNLHADKNQKEIDTAISTEEFSRLKRKSNIAYFIAKNNLPFNKYSDLVDLVSKEGNLDREKDIGSLYVYRKGCTEFIDCHGDVSLEKICESLSASNFFSILMDGTTSHKKEKEAVYVQVFQKDLFIKGGNPTNTLLLHLAEPRGISVNADELKDCLIRSLKTLEPTYNFDELTKKFVSICTDGAASNIGRNNSLYTRLKEDYEWLISFWCICHRLELAIKDSIGEGLLSDIKECLLKLYYLYDKSSKRLRSLQELKEDLQGLIELQDNYINDNGVAPLKASGTRWIGHLVNALQRAINNFGLYMKDLENLAKEERNKSESLRLLAYLKKWRDFRFLLGMGLFLHILMPLKELSLGWQKDFTCAVEQELKLKKALSNLLLIKSICDKGKVLELPYVKSILANTDEEGNYQTFHLTNIQRAKETISHNAVTWCDKVIDCVHQRFDEDINKEVIDYSNKILNPQIWQCEVEQVSDSVSDLNREYAEVPLFTESDLAIEYLGKRFEKPLVNAGVECPCLKMEFRDLMEYAKKHYNIKSINYITMWRMIFQLESIGCNEYSNIIRLVELCFVFAVSNSRSETGFSYLRRAETDFRSSLSEHRLSSIMRISMDGPPYMENDSTEAVNKFLEKKKRRPGAENNGKRKMENKSDTQHSQSSSLKKSKLVQKKLFQLND